MQVISISDDALLATHKFLNAQRECDLDDAGLSPLEKDDFGELFHAVQARYQDVTKRSINLGEGQ